MKALQFAGRVKNVVSQPPNVSVNKNPIFCSLQLEILLRIIAAMIYISDETNFQKLDVDLKNSCKMSARGRSNWVAQQIHHITATHNKTILHMSLSSMKKRPKSSASYQLSAQLAMIWRIK